MAAYEQCRARDTFSIACRSLGMPDMGSTGPSTEGQPAPAREREPKAKKPGALDILRGELGR